MKSSVRPIAYLVTSIRGGVKESHYEAQDGLGLQEVLEHDTAVTLYAQALERKCHALQQRVKLLERMAEAVRAREDEI